MNKRKRRRYPTTKRLHAAGMTVSGWARINGFAPASAAKVIAGELAGDGPIGRAIIGALKKDGFWVAPPAGGNLAEGMNPRCA